MKRHDTEREPAVRRFSRWALFQHGMVMLLFTLLLVTGLPQKWPQADLSQWLVGAMGGIFATRWIHRAAGYVFSAMAVIHLALAVVPVLLGKAKATMMLTRQDFRDTLQNMRYYLGKVDKPPKFGRYDYKQKYEYWGMIFGSMVMIGTGFALLFPVVVSRILPAEIIPIAKALHTNEALLALSIILVWHAYGAHLNPDVFPCDTSMFTGKISKERLHHEHALEYEEMFGGEEAGKEAAASAVGGKAAEAEKPPLRLVG